jgi:hypothetical protein
MAKGLFTLDNVDWREVWDNYLLPGIDRYNEFDKTDFAALLCQEDDETRKKYLLRTANTFQSLAHGERPEFRKGVKGSFQKLTEKFGTGIGYDLDTLKDMRLQDILDYQAGIIIQDRENIRSEILKAMLQSSTDGFFNAAFESDEGITAPPPYGQNTFLASHTHYLGTASSEILLVEIPDWRKHIIEHGFGKNIIGFINSAQEADIAKMLTPSTAGTLKVANPLTDKIAVDGYLARAGGVEWVTTECMPEDYVLLVSTDLNANMNKPAKLIYPTNSSYRGLLLLHGGNGQYPIIDSYYLRWLGAKVLHRGAGVVVRLGNANWADPTIV